MSDWVVYNAKVVSQVEAKNKCIEVVVAHVIEKKQVKILGSH